MKKRLLLALPVLLALSACNGVSPKTNVKNNDEILEDASAHGEVFGDNAVGLPLKERRLSASTPVADLLGYQMYYDKNNTDADTSDDKLAIRYIVGITSKSVDVYWKRAVSDNEGGFTKSLADNYNPEAATEAEKHTYLKATKYYTSLSDGESTISTTDPKYAKYKDAGFVVYTLYNIPYEDNKTSYVAAYAIVNDGENETRSDVGVAKIEKKVDALKSKNSFTFNFFDDNTYDDNIGRHFLEGTINGEDKKVLKAVEGSSGNLAAYIEQPLQAGDSFGSFYFQSNCFQYCGFDTFFENKNLYSDDPVLEGYATPLETGLYDLFVSRGSQEHPELFNHVYTTSVNVWSVSCGDGDPVVLHEDPEEAGKFIGQIDVTAGQTLHIYKNGDLDTTTYSVTEDVAMNNVNISFVAKFTGTSNVYLNTNKSVWLSVPSTANRTIDVSLGGFDTNDNDVFYVWAWGDNRASAWYAYNNTTHQVTIPADCDKLQVVRMNGDAENLPSWDAKWNETINISVEQDKVLTFGDWHSEEDYGKAYFTWENPSN